MFSEKPKKSPLVSLVITCYNHGQYLARAIESVLEQSHKEVEIIVVDDGSTDNTKSVADNYPIVKYVYQSNQGLSAARNTGIDYSSGAYLVFLDADDWLLTAALSTNLKYLKQRHEAAFVSGNHIRINERKEIVRHTSKFVKENHYCHFLQDGNYIQMHATVMYRRWIFEIFRYDVLLKACEDYDLYLKISRKYPIFHHTELIAAYYLHKQNMSGNIPMMLDYALLVLSRQSVFLANSEEEKCFQRGLKFWEKLYCTLLYKKKLFTPELDKNNDKAKELSMLWKHRKLLYLKYLILKPLMPVVLKPLMFIKSFIDQNVPGFILRRLYKAGIYKSPPLGKINFGDFNRTTPFNKEFGYSRGGPVDRYYIENFLRQQSGSIKGRVLEIGGNEYTLQFGGSKVTQSDVLNIDDKNPKATFIGDLSSIPILPADSFDCIILTQTLHLIYSYKEALETCNRILKPGGTLLITVPGISHIDQGEWRKYWLWSFTQTSITRLLTEIFPAENILVETYGNVLVATAFLYGIGLPEIKKEQMDDNDPHYQVIISASAVKPDSF